MTTQPNISAGIAVATVMLAVSPDAFANPRYTKPDGNAYGKHSMSVSDQELGRQSEKTQWFDARHSTSFKPKPLIARGYVRGRGQWRSVFLDPDAYDGDHCGLIYTELDAPEEQGGTKRAYRANLANLRPQNPFTVKTINREGRTYKGITFHCAKGRDCFKGQSYTCPVEPEWDDSRTYANPNDVPGYFASMKCVADPEYVNWESPPSLSKSKVTLLVAPDKLAGVLEDTMLAFQCNSPKQVGSGSSKVRWEGLPARALKGRIESGEAAKQLCRTEVWGRMRLGHIAHYSDNAVEGGKRRTVCRLPRALGHLYGRDVPGWNTSRMLWYGSQKDYFYEVEKLSVENPTVKRLEESMTWKPPSQGSYFPPTRAIKLGKTTKPAQWFRKSANAHICRHNSTGRVGEFVSGVNECRLLDGSTVTSNYKVLAATPGA